MRAQKACLPGTEYPAGIPNGHPAVSRPPGGRTGLERRLDGGGHELRGLRVDDDVPAKQHAADDLPGVPGRRPAGGSCPAGPGVSVAAGDRERECARRACDSTRVGARARLVHEHLLTHRYRQADVGRAGVARPVAD